MNTRYNSKKTLSEELLEKFEANLCQNINEKRNFDISNSIAGKAQIVHKVMFQKAENPMFMFLRGFRKEIFDKEDVIAEFIKSCKKYQQINTSEPFVNIVIKEEIKNIKKNFQESVFMARINDEFGIEKVFRIKYIDPKAQILLKYKPIIEQEDSQELNVLKVEDFNRNIVVSEIPSFQIFNNVFVRVRQDVSKSSESKAIIHYNALDGLPTKIKNIFDELLNSKDCKVYSF